MLQAMKIRLKWIFGAKQLFKMSGLRFLPKSKFRKVLIDIQATKTHTHTHTLNVHISNKEQMMHEPNDYLQKDIHINAEIY